MRTIAVTTGHAVDPDLLEFLVPCYLAFQLGAWTMATGAESAISRRYEDRLSRLIGVPEITLSPAP
jgi:hypothetical protein